MLRRAPLRVLGALLVGCLALAAPAARAGDAANTIVFYDPDANYEALPRAISSLREQNFAFVTVDELLRP